MYTKRKGELVYEGEFKSCTKLAEMNAEVID